MDCAHCHAEIPDAEGCVLRYELVGRWVQDVQRAREERRRVASEHVVLCAECGERVLERLRSVLSITVTTQTRERIRAVSA